MTRGLSKQQKQILAMLETKKIPNSKRDYFSTDEIISELHPEYRLWLVTVPPFSRGPRSQNRSRPYDKYRISVYRALRSLERKGLVVSSFWCHSRHWAVPNRVSNDFGGRRGYYLEPWKWGAFVRTLPRDLRIAYNLRIFNQEEAEKIKGLWEEYKKEKGIAPRGN